MNATPAFSAASPLPRCPCSSSFAAATSATPRRPTRRPAAVPRAAAAKPAAAAAKPAAAAAASSKPAAKPVAKPSPPAAAPKTAPHLGKLVVLGLSHHTATVDVRERLAVPEADWQTAAHQLLASCPALTEAAVLSTCNRFELYLVASHPYEAIQQAVAALSARSGVPAPALRTHLFMLVDDDACWHLMRVAAGLDSLVIGEGQILSQVKKCYELATDKPGAAGKILSRLLNVAVSAGKRVRAETGIAKGAVSISSAAVELAELRADDDVRRPLPDARVAIIGAGKMARLLVQHLVSRGLAALTIVNRSSARAEELAKMFPDTDIAIEPMDRLVDVTARSDIVFTSTAAEGPILARADVEGMRSPDEDAGAVMLIDISVPRNVAADVAGTPGVAAYNVDDLKAVVAKNQARRRRLMLDAEDVLREEQATFNNWHNSLGCIPAISKLQQRAESIRQDELERVKGKLAGLSASEKKAVEALSKGIVNKMLHSPMVHLRGLEDMEERNLTLKHIEALFKL